MKKDLVLYYSKNGSNRFLGEMLADRLNSEIEEIKPVINSRLLMLMGLGIGNKRVKSKVRDYDRVFLCGPIWMGKFIYPLKRFVKKHSSEINELVFVTCCGSGYEKKDEKFGHGLVFNQVREVFPGNNIKCAAFPITLVVPEAMREDPNAIMGTRLNHENFKGEIADRFNDFFVSLL